LSQTLREIEIICTIDGSTDKSPEIVNGYADKDPRLLIFRQENSGPGTARNTALNHVHGKYILFCDADDSLEQNAAAECYAVMESKSCDMVVFNTNIIEDGRSVAGLKNSAGEYIRLINPENEGMLDKKACIKTMLIATVWGKMFRADLIEKYRLRFSRHMIGEDARFLLSYLLVLKTGCAVNNVFYNYYLRPKTSFNAAHPWIGRLFRFPGIFLDVFKFALRIGKPFRIFFFFYWLAVFFRSRKRKAENRNHKNSASFAQKLYTLTEKTVKKLVGFLGLGNSKVTVTLSKIRARLKKRINISALESFDIYVAEHCNLGCYSCNHFSQLAAPEFADLAATERDLKRLSGLSDGNIPAIMLVGGEPLLNPELPEFMRIARQYFPRSRVQIVTNGILLLAQKDIFWESVKKYNVIMTPTKYPGIAWEKIEERAAEFDYTFDYFDLSGSSEKVSRKFSLDLSGSQEIEKSFRRCPMAACTVALRNGRLATCSFVFCMRHFNTYFDQHIPVTEDDSIDIYKTKTMREIVDFLNSPIPLCRFCRKMGAEIVGPWRKTKKAIEEWT
jgi:glycosyltransferase involved in cell wall biosynthesis